MEEEMGGLRAGTRVREGGRADWQNMKRRELMSLGDATWRRNGVANVRAVDTPPPAVPPRTLADLEALAAQVKAARALGSVDGVVPVPEAYPFRVLAMAALAPGVTRVTVDLCGQADPDAAEADDATVVEYLHPRGGRKRTREEEGDGAGGDGRG
jgi:hypothetical protein